MDQGRLPANGRAGALIKKGNRRCFGDRDRRAWTRRIVFVELAYYWSFTASLQAVLTPDLGVTFPNLLYFTYHAGAIVAAAGLAMLIAAATITNLLQQATGAARPSF